MSHSLHASRLLRRLLVLLVILACFPAWLRAEESRHVLIITVDGFAAFYLTDPQAPVPTFRRLAEEGAVAQGMIASNPSVTWPNHTTLITGVRPARHSVLFNGVLVRPALEAPVAVDPRRDGRELIAVPTLIDLLHEAGLATAGINWPCTRNTPSLHDDFPDVPEQVTHTTPRLRRELIAAGILNDETDRSFLSLSAAAKDQVWTAAACHVIRARKPSLLLFHMLVTDGIQHRYGPQTPAAYTALAQADGQLRDVLAALADAGIRDRTTIFIVADHGFASATKILNPNVLLKQQGLLKTEVLKVTRARAQAISEGGIAMVYLNNPQTRSDDRERVRAIFQEQEGIAEVTGPERFAQLGLPDPDKNEQMADLILVGKDGYAFSSSAIGEEYVTPATLGQVSVGHHGYLSTDPKMHAVFIAAGSGIKRGVRLERVENIDVAPTAAHLLGQKLRDVDGRVIVEILSERP